GGSNGARATNHHTPSHAAPNNPVATNAARQPYRSATGVIMTGARMAPIEAPLYEIPMPRDRLPRGRESAAVRRPPGNVAPSPKPSSARAAANPRSPVIHAWEALASDQIPTAINMPRRRPT